jgi:hypothetical protein
VGLRCDVRNGSDGGSGGGRSDKPTISHRRESGDEVSVDSLISPV